MLCCSVHISQFIDLLKFLFHTYTFNIHITHFTCTIFIGVIPFTHILNVLIPRTLYFPVFYKKKTFLCKRTRKARKVKHNSTILQFDIVFSIEFCPFLVTLQSWVSEVSRIQIIFNVKYMCRRFFFQGVWNIETISIIRAYSLQKELIL